MLLIEINSISNMGCHKYHVILLGFMIWDFMNPHKISANSDHKHKRFIPKKMGVLLFQTKKSDFLNSDTC